MTEIDALQARTDGYLEVLINVVAALLMEAASHSEDTRQRLDGVLKEMTRQLGDADHRRQAATPDLQAAQDIRLQTSHQAATYLLGILRTAGSD